MQRGRRPGPEEGTCAGDYANLLQTEYTMKENGRGILMSAFYVVIKERVGGIEHIPVKSEECGGFDYLV